MFPCPASFVYQNGICTCDPVLNSLLPVSITTCDINYQTILRPAGIVGYLLLLLMTHINITSLLIVHYTTVYLNHHNSISQLLTHSVSSTGLVCCVDTVNKVSVLSLVIIIVNTALMYTYSLLYQ